MAATAHTRQASRSAAIRTRLGFPIIDCDGHTVENPVVLADYIASLGGPSLADRFRALLSERSQGDAKALAFEKRITRTPWWAIPARNTLDLATAMMPRLMYERLPEMGLDYTVLYTTLGFNLPAIEDEELRRASCRALNQLRAEMVRGLEDRMAAAAVIPMHTPREAIEELEYAVGELKMKAAMMASFVRRPIPAVADKSPQLSAYAYWMDVYGIDSDYDYDPLWAKCVELGIAPTFHSLGYGWGSRQSISNYVYNHVGNFAASAEAICKGLFMGGVPARFPQLRFGFLEGGVAWAIIMYCDLIGHWEKRNKDAVQLYNPALIDTKLFSELAARYARRNCEGDGQSLLRRRNLQNEGYVPSRDEFERSGVRSPEDIRDIFDRFYFGCEGDDPLNATAFNPRGIPLSARLHPLYGSDIGHWDVPEMADVACEAYELVEHGLVSERDLREFLFENSVKFWAAANPAFFRGTAVESEVQRYLEQNPARDGREAPVGKP